MSAHFARCVSAPLPNLRSVLAWSDSVTEEGGSKWGMNVVSIFSSQWLHLVLLLHSAGVCVCLRRHVDHMTDKPSAVASLIKNEKPMSFKTASGCSHLQDDWFLDWELWGVWLVHCLMPVVFLMGLVPSGMFPGCSVAILWKMMFAHKARWSLWWAESVRLIGAESVRLIGPE